MRILLVEDYRELAGALTWALARDGHVVTAVGTAAEAEASYRRDAFDVVVLDLRLPDGDGWTLMQKLAARRPVAGIALSGLACPDDVERSRLAGFAMHLPKPVDVGLLLNQIALLPRAADHGTVAAR